MDAYNPMPKRGNKKKSRQRKFQKASFKRGDRLRAARAPVPKWSLNHDPIVTSRPLEDGDRIGPDSRSAKYAGLSEVGKSLVLIEVANDLFDIQNENGLYTVKRIPSADLVKKLADTVVNCWPRDWRPSIQTPPKDDFALLFWGPHTPDSVLNCITRASLYADRILVLNPFSDAAMYHPQYSPLLEPQKWIQQFALHALFLSTVEPWVKSGIVEIIQNPVYFDVKLWRSLAEDTSHRMEKFPPNAQKELLELFLIDGAVDQCLSVSSEHRERILDLLGLRGEIRGKVLSQIVKTLRQDPIREAIPYIIPERSHITSTGEGMTYDHAKLIAAAHGASIFTNRQMCSYRLRLEASELKSPFQRAAQAFSRSKLDFLNNVPSDFAIGLRKDGRLADFRSYLTSFATATPEGTSTGSAETDVVNRLEYEYAKYKVEWRDIQRKLAISGSIIGLTGAVAVISGLLPIVGILSTAMSAESMLLVDEIFDRKRLERQPLGILMELERS